MIRIVPKEHMEILRKYLGGESSVVLIDEAVLNNLPAEVVEKIQKLDGSYCDYNFGGNADVWVDWVADPNHYFLKNAVCDTDEKDEEE